MTCDCYIVKIKERQSGPLDYLCIADPGGYKNHKALNTVPIHSPINGPNFIFVCPVVPEIVLPNPNLITLSPNLLARG